MKFKIQTIAVLLMPVILMVALLSCNNDHKANDQRKGYVIPDSLFKTLKIDTVSEDNVEDYISLNGSVDFNQDHVSRIYPMVSGTIHDVNLMLGDHVNAGQVLGIIRSGDMAGYNTALINAETNVGVAKKNKEAKEDMFRSGLASQPDLIQAKAAYDQAVAELNRAKQVLKINGGSTNGNYIIKAPVSGFIVEKNITNNTSIRSDNGTSMFTIADLKKVWIMANVYESNVGNVHLGDQADITTLSYPDRIFKGKVDKIYNVLDPTNKVMKVRISIPNEDYALKPQMFAKVGIKRNSGKKALYVPKGAIIFDHSEYYVLVFKSKSDIRITKVNLLNTTEDKTFISSGLKAGDSVIASDALQIYEALNN